MLRPLESREINQVLDANFQIWSPGLDRSRYRHYQWWQFNSDWGRRHINYFGYFVRGELVASCKRYRFEYQSRGKVYKIAGIGAVFVPDEKRGHSYGLKMLQELGDHCADEGFDGALLNSDIDPDYYARIGYEKFEASAFSVTLTDAWLRDAIKTMDALSDKELDETFNVRSLEAADFAEMCRHHRRWLAGREYGLRRSVDYWRYKLGREHYLFQHSSLNWPKMDIITDNFGEFVSGYALIEQSGPYMRVLEVMGPERIRHSLWGQILRLAEKRETKTLRGWSVVRPPLKGLHGHRRDWSFPMICPLNEDVEDELLAWTEVHPPTMLELDHF